MDAVARRVSNRRFERGALLFSEGDPCTGLFVVASGKIRIFKLSPAGREQVLAVEGPGNSFAELTVFEEIVIRLLHCSALFVGATPIWV